MARRDLPGGDCLGGCLPGGVHPYCMLGYTPLWTEWLTDRCKNITFLQLRLRAVIMGFSRNNIFKAKEPLTFQNKHFEHIATSGLPLNYVKCLINKLSLPMLTYQSDDSHSLWFTNNNIKPIMRGSLQQVSHKRIELYTANEIYNRIYVDQKRFPTWNEQRNNQIINY